MTSMFMSSKPADDDVVSLGGREGAVEHLTKANERLSNQNERILGGMRLLMREPFQKYAQPIVRGFIDRIHYRKALRAILRTQTTWRWALCLKMLRRHVAAQVVVAKNFRTYAVMTKTPTGLVLTRSRRYARERDSAILASRLHALEADTFKEMLDKSTGVLAEEGGRLKTMAEKCRENGLSVETCRSMGFTPQECLDAGYTEDELEEGFLWRDNIDVGELLDARDMEGRWLDAVVVEKILEDGTHRLKIHFRGWSDKWDALYDRDSTDLQPHHSKVDDWRKTIQTGDMCEVRAQTTKKSLWYLGIVANVERNRVQVLEWQKIKKLKPFTNARGAPWIDSNSEEICKAGTHFKRFSPPPAVEEDEDDMFDDKKSPVSVVSVTDKEEAAVMAPPQKTDTMTTTTTEGEEKLPTLEEEVVAK